MRKIHLLKWSECFFERSTTNSIGLWSDGFWRVLGKGLAHPRIATSVFGVCFILLAWHYPVARFLAVTLLVGRVFLYQQLMSLSRNLELKLKPKETHFRYGQQILFSLELENRSWWTLYAADLELQFAGDRNLSLQASLDRAMFSGESCVLQFAGLCDVGMGEYPVGPITIKLSDLFGIYEITISETREEKIVVLPKVGAMGCQIGTKSNVSDLFGLKEVPVRGVDVNFSGLRPFLNGDNIRHIAWRRSAHFGQLIVKEFEKLVPSDVSIIANLDPTFQVGSTEGSTWETIKSLCINLASQTLKEGHSVRFAYNKKYLERGFGSEHLHRIINSLMAYNIEDEIRWSDRPLGDDLANATTRVFFSNPLVEWQLLWPSGSTLFYIAPIHYNHLVFLRESFQKFMIKNIEVVLFLVNPLKVWTGTTLEFDWDGRFQNSYRLTGLLNDFQKSGIRIYQIDMGGNIERDLQPFHFQSFQEVP